MVYKVVQNIVTGFWYLSSSPPPQSYLPSTIVPIFPTIPGKAYSSRRDTVICFILLVATK